MAGGTLDTGSMPASDVPRGGTSAERLRAEAAALTRYQRTRDPALRAAIIEDHLPLARRVALRYVGSTESADDLFQVACLGLVKAVDRFDPARGSAFSSYAIPTMTGEVLRHFRDFSWSLRVPRELQQLVLDVQRTRQDLRRSRGREPKVDEIADALGADAASVLEALDAVAARRAQSLDAPASSQGPDDPEPMVAHVGCEEPGYERAELRLLLEALERRLCEHERRILRLGLVGDLTQREIARRVGVSQMTVSRTLRDLRDELTRLGQREGTSARRPPPPRAATCG